ncbi:Receptor-type tyrosine-protein phosphatase T [Halotydeus destructor]|nr:Receptor-type tyrosine-protein phosphatase T [Halotydeus destructor]
MYLIRILYIIVSANLSYSTVIRASQSKEHVEHDPRGIFEGKPSVIVKNDREIQLTVYPLVDQERPNFQIYYIAVYVRSGERFQKIDDSIQFYDFSKLYHEQSEKLYTVHRFNVADGLKTGNALSIMIGDGVVRNDYSNPPLNPNLKYTFVFVAWNSANNQEIIFSRTVQPENPEDQNNQLIQIIIIIFLSILLVITVIILIFLLYVNCTGDEKLQKIVTFWYKPEAMSSRAPLATFNTYNDDSEDEGPVENFAERDVTIRSHPVPISELATYIESMSRDDGFKAEYFSVPRGQTAPWTSAKTQDNKGKNRYGNLLAYDDNRVKLDVEDEDLDGIVEDNCQSTDYINASFVDGYKRDKRYIATQGPCSNTLTDFWRMVWQTDSRIVIMLSNLEEDGRNKCDKYWPEEMQTYGQYRVTVIGKEVFADYVVRKFYVEKGEFKREVIQYHFVSWPDHAVPTYSVSLIAFLRKIRSSHAYKVKANPVIIHCSAGIGRTGTLVLIDIMFDMAEAERQVDFLKYFCQIRKSRVNMIEKVNQYVFCHQILLEAFCYESTDFNCNNISNYILGVSQKDSTCKKTLIEVQYQALDKLVPKYTEENYSVAIANASMNRNANILPPNRARVILDMNNGGDYINAVYVNGYKRRDAYIVTEVPLANCRNQFWAMISQTGSRTIVLLNDLPLDEIYWPTDSSNSVHYGGVEVKLVKQWAEVSGALTVRLFQVADRLSVKMYQYNQWSSADVLPGNRKQALDVMVSLLDLVEKWQFEGQATKIIVQCLNGARASGVFCASSFLCDRIKEEHQVDVFLASRTIRTQRQLFIENVDQLYFLYQFAERFLENFQTYANFK